MSDLTIEEELDLLREKFSDEDLEKAEELNSLAVPQEEHEKN